MPVGVTGRLPIHGDDQQCRTTKHRWAANIEIGKMRKEVTSISRILIFLLPAISISGLLALAAKARWRTPLALQSLSRLPRVTMDAISGLSHNVSSCPGQLVFGWLPSTN